MSEIERQQNSPLNSLVRIRQNNVRSVNIEQDLNNSAMAKNYIVTAQSHACLARILNRMNDTAPVRAWTLTGPYGSGKSFFGLFLMNLMCASQPAHSDALQRLHENDPILAEHLTAQARLSDTAGLLPVPITGFRAPIYECLKQGFRQALKHLEENARLSPLLATLEQWSAATDSRAILRWIQSLREVISHPSLAYAGLLLIFDELGKPLEHAALHADRADVYLLQEMAELANRSEKTPFLFIGILHQAFERYAALLDSTTQREWSKVQGRFEDISFQEPPTQQMWLIANAFEYTQPERVEEGVRWARAYAQEAIQQDWRPAMIQPEDFINLCARVYPLHPTALVTLPFLFRRLAQNERSIFAYLASFEPFGLQEFLQQHRVPEVVRLADLFDYLSANFQGRLYASGRARALTEAIERLNNSIHLNPTEAAVLKTISLLNWLGEVSHLQATEPMLMAALRGPEMPDDLIRQTLRSLQTRSLIVFRKFNRTYTIWQGSDVDIEERLDAARQQLTAAFSIAEAVQRYLPPAPLVARRHSYQTGTLRYFEVRYVDLVTRAQVLLTPGAGASGLVLLCLPANAGEVEQFTTWAQTPPLCERRDILIGIAGRTTRLAELLHEMRCLDWVKDHTPELRDDPVARRELRARLSEMETLIHIELDRNLSLHRLSDSAGQWFHQGQALSLPVGQGLSHLLSNLCGDLYDQSPRLWNELINRRVLSSQGAAARRNLIEAMLLRADQPALGIEGFPPERSMYESLLRSSGLHRPSEDNTWILGDLPEEDPLNLKAVWKTISDFIFQPPPEPRPVSALFQILSAPPFGLTDGVLPVFLCAFMVAHQHETTLYREGTLLPEPGIPDWEVLLRRPELFAVAGCRITGARQALIERFARAYHTHAAVMPVVRTLIRQLKSLPEHAWRTQRLPQTALAVRKAVEDARSPERFLFHDLPIAVNVEPFTQDVLEPAHIEAFFSALSRALEALNMATPNLRKWARDEFLKSFGFEPGEQGWQQFVEAAGEMAPRVTHPSLIPLLKRATEAADERAALESVLAQVANRPLKNWGDADRERFASQARYLGGLFQAERDGGPTLQSAIPPLTPLQRIRSQQIAQDLQRYVQEHFADDPNVLRAALLAILDDVYPLTKL